MSSTLWDQHTEKDHMPDGRAPGPDADSVTSHQQTWRTEDWKQEGLGFPQGLMASISLSGPPRGFYVGGAGGAPK